MKVKDSRIGNTTVYLPSFAQLLLDKYLHHICVDQLELSRQHDLPLLKYLAHLQDEQILELTKVSIIEFLNCLINRKDSEFIRISLERWLADQLDVVGKFEVEPRDITIINYIRAKSLKRLVNEFTNDVKVIIELIDEIDLFFLNFNTAGMDTYIEILKDRLQKETEFNAKLTNALPGMVFIYDLIEKRALYTNQNGLKMLGYNDDTTRINTLDFYRTVIHPQDLLEIEGFYKNYENAQDGEVKNFEYRMKDVEGNYKWLRNYVLLFSRNEQGKPKEVIGVAFDVTEEKRIAETLAKRETQLLEAQSIAHIGSYEWNIVENSSLNTPELYKIFEIGEAEKLESFMHHVHPDDVEKVRSALDASFTSGIYECEYRYIAGNKEKVIWSKGFVTTDNGVPQKMIGTIQDITERKQIETDLLKKSQELEQSNEILQHFASLASHDLKEPLRKISLLSDRIFMTEKGNLSAASGESFIKIRDAAGRMQKMIDDILSYSSLNIPEEKTSVSLQAILDDVIDIFEYSLIEKNATITSNNLPVSIVAPSQIRQLFQNIIANSLKFSKAGTPGVISVEHRVIHAASPLNTRYLELTIKDNGIGFSPEDAKKIFGLFSRLNTKTAYPGNGIGLAICKRIVDNHDGSISASSEPGKGSVFTITIPQ